MDAKVIRFERLHKSHRNSAILDSKYRGGMVGRTICTPKESGAVTFDWQMVDCPACLKKRGKGESHAAPDNNCNHPDG